MRAVLRATGVVFAFCCAAVSIGLLVDFPSRNGSTGELNWDALLFGLVFAGFAIGTGVILVIGREPDRALGRAGQVFGWLLFAVASTFIVLIAIAVITDPGY
jgi:hypothetical protein